MIRQTIVFAVSLIIVVFASAFLRLPILMADTAPADSPDTSQPRLKFSHQKHIKDIGVDCATCHPATAVSKLSSDNLVSTHDQCAGCHQEQVTSDCGYCHRDTANIAPRAVVQRTVIFSHEKHLAMKDVECTTCHKGLNETDLSSAKNLPDMATCTNCHNDAKATRTCEACHTDFVTLLPQNHKLSDFIHSHREEIRLEGLTANCQTCHTETFCQQCHQGSGLKAFLRKDMMVEPRPKTSTKDAPKQMVLQNVHELNYRFTHGIDAKSEQSDCASCHSLETFCAQCHQAGGNVTQGVFKPRSHMVPGFATLGRGSGGGLHAEEARRDLESCVSCHDVEGRDPTCLTCHTPTGQVR